MVVFITTGFTAVWNFTFLRVFPEFVFSSTFSRIQMKKCTYFPLIIKRIFNKKNATLCVEGLNPLLYDHSFPFYLFSEPATFGNTLIISPQQIQK